MTTNKIGTLTTVGGGLDLGLWQFNSTLADTSGNGRTLSVTTGTARYAKLWAKGPTGFFCDGSTRLTNGAAALNPAGSFTAQALVVKGNLTGSTEGLFGFCGTTNNAVDNTQYGLTLGTDQLLLGFQESGAGVDATQALGACLYTGRPYLVTLTRSGLTTYSLYLNDLLYTTGAAITAPDGGSTAVFTVGGVKTFNFIGIICSLRLISGVRSGSDIAADYAATLGTNWPTRVT